MEHISCTTCDYTISFGHDLTKYVVFICPKCQSENRMQDGSFVFHQKRIQHIDEYKLFNLELGDEFKEGTRKYRIVSFVEKKSISYKWLEIGAINLAGEECFFSINFDGQKREVMSLKPFPLPKQFNLERSRSQGVKKNRKAYVFSDRYEGNILFATGLIGYDIDKKAEYHHYDEDTAQNNGTFVSIEKIGDEMFSYVGKYISLTNLLYKFKLKQADYKERYDLYKKNFYKLFFMIVALLMLLFAIFNMRALYGKKEVRFLSDQVVFKQDNFVNGGYVLEYPISFPKHLKNGVLTIDGSLHSNTMQAINAFRLIEHHSHKSLFDKPIFFEYNAGNVAKAIDMKFRGLSPGDYTLQLEFVTNHQIQRVASSIDGLSDQNTELVDIDLRLTTGHKVLWWPILIALGGIVMIFYIAYENLQSYFSYLDVSYKYILSINNHLYFIFMIMIFVTYIAIESYLAFGNRIEQTSLEEANYIGRRYHHVHSTYAGHK